MEKPAYVHFGIIYFIKSYQNREISLQYYCFCYSTRFQKPKLSPIQKISAYSSRITPGVWWELDDFIAQGISKKRMTDTEVIWRTPVCRLDWNIMTTTTNMKTIFRISYGIITWILMDNWRRWKKKPAYVHWWII